MGVFDVPKYIHGAAFEKGVSIELLMSVVYLLLILFYVSRLIYYLKYVDADIFVVTGISRFVCFKYRGAVYTVSHAWKPLIFRTDSYHFSWDFKNYGLDLSCTSKPQFSDLRSGIVVVCKMVIDGVIVPKRAEVCIVTFRGRNYYAAAFGNYPGSSGSPVYQDLNLVGVYGYNVLQNDGLWYSILQPVLEEDDHPIAYDINGIGLFYGSTGSGKTSQMIRLIRAGTGKKFLVVSPTVFLMEQMIDRMKESGINPSFQNYKGSTIADGIQYGNPNVIVTTAYGLDIGKYIGYRIFIDEFDYPSAEYFNMMRKVKGMNYIAMSATTHKHNRIVEDSTVPFRRIGVSQVFGLLNNCKKLGKSVLIIHHVPSHIQNIIDTFNFEIITSRNSGDFRKYPLWSSGPGEKHKVLDKHGAFVVTTPIARRGIAVNFDVIIDYGKEVVLHVDKYITRKIVSCSYATIQQSYGRLAGRRPGEFYLIDTQLELQLRCSDELLLAYYESLDGIYRFPTYDFSLLGRLKDPLPVTDPQSVLLLTLHNSRQADSELAKLGISVEPKATRDEPILVEPVMMYTGKVKMTEAVYGYPLYNSALEWLCFILFEFIFRFTFGHVRVAKCSRIMIWHYMIDVLVLIGSILLDIYHSHLKLFGLGYALGVFITTAFTYSRVALVMRERSVEKLKTHRAGDILVNDIFVYGLDPVIVTFMVSFNPIIIGINMVFAYMLSMYYADLSDLGSKYYRHMALNIREMKQYLSPDERTRRMDEFSALYYKETLEPRALFITVFGHKYGSGMEEDIENPVKDPHFPPSKPNFRIYSILMIIANGIMGSKGSVLLYGYVLITTFPVLFKYSDTIVNNLPTTVRVWYHRYPAEWLLVAAPVIGHIYHYSEFYKFFALHE